MSVACYAVVRYLSASRPLMEKGRLGPVHQRQWQSASFRPPPTGTEQHWGMLNVNIMQNEPKMNQNINFFLYIFASQKNEQY